MQCKLKNNTTMKTTNLTANEFVKRVSNLINKANTAAEGAEIISKGVKYFNQHYSISQLDEHIRDEISYSGDWQVAQFIERIYDDFEVIPFTEEEIKLILGK